MMLSSSLPPIIGPLLFTASLFYTSTNAVSLTVDTTVGTVYGLINGSNPNVAQFLGIPYAEPPVGQLRWAPPVPKSPVGVIDATYFGPSCPQVIATAQSDPNVYTVDSRDFLIYGPTSEDCLRLSVWKPATTPSNADLPVIMFFYGGGLSTGGMAINYQIPTRWVERSQSHIAVVFKFLSSQRLWLSQCAGLNQTEQNLGLLDQRLAVEWVQANIASFGGDPSRITIWGQSAGAESVNYYQFAHPDDPIVAGVICDSGTALPISFAVSPSTSGLYTDFTLLAGHLGCGNLSATAELACMRNVSADTIEGFLTSYTGTPTLSFGAIADNKTVFANYTQLFNEGMTAKMPTIFGSNNNEGGSLGVWFENGTAENYTNANTITLSILCAAEQSAILRYPHNATTYRYYYAGNFTNISPQSWEDAYHSSELPLVMGTYGITHGPSSAFEEAVSVVMQDLWLAFMTDPENGPPAQGWPVWSPDGSVIEFGREDLVTQLLPNSMFPSLCTSEGTAMAGGVPPL
ncbi:chlorogenic acid esterase precursor [Mollisia scopiformis]|uniref:Carboxylic ester hydrolase n=1 Tax=Mollisia scopiformis TaxID=149040 RepID=A0A132BBY1_MOLSC|nr:chlorogenic acid esterase precursor [Mollisia scopiformis]KUJ09773.1 chlorogenic acid esterase precursor [Mollisia scopiformis]